jgi:hypothetical protein
MKKDNGLRTGIDMIWLLNGPSSRYSHFSQQITRKQLGHHTQKLNQPDLASELRGLDHL